MRIARGGLDPVVAQQLPDHAQALAERQRTARPGMPQVMDTYIFEPGPGTHDQPRIVDVGHARTRLLPGDHPRVVRNPGNFRQHAGHGGCQRHHARAALAVAQPQLPRRPVDVVPPELQHLVAPAPGQHQQPDRRRRMPRHLPLRLQLIDRPAEPAILLVRQEPLARVRPVLAHRPAWVRPVLPQAPFDGQRQHLGHDLQHRVRRMGLAAHRVMQFHHLLAPDLAHTHLAQRRQDVVVERPPVDLRARRPAVRGHVIAHVALGENGHRRLGRRRRGNRVLAPLDAVDGLRRQASCPVGGEFPVPSKRRPLRPAGAA